MRALAVCCVATATALNVQRRNVLGGAATAALAVAPATAAQTPAVGFGLYKTPESDAEDAVGLALAAGVRHFDTAAAYGNEAALGRALRASGLPRSELFVATKIDAKAPVRDQVAAAAERLKLAPDCVSLHAPLAPKATRLGAWAALADAKRDGLTASIGLANFGARHMDELLAVGPAPALVQLEISPYAQRPAETAWAKKRGAAVSCAAWSKLSGSWNWGSDAAFRTLAGTAKAHGATKAQVLVRWAFQRGFVALPRSGTSDSAQRLAIAQNSLAGVSDGEYWKDGPLTRAEMRALDGLEVGLASGRLGRTDGWEEKDVTGLDWDPTTYVG